MLYYALIKKIEPDEYDGNIVFEVNEEMLSFYYQAPRKFAEACLLVGREIMIDIWIGCVDMIKELPSFSQYIPFGQYPTDGDASGFVHSILGTERFRLDCGKLMFDVQVHSPILFGIGSNLLISGSRQVFFPNTEWSYENVGCI